MTDFDPREDALATYTEACRLARDGHEGVRGWFGGKTEYSKFLASKRPASVASGIDGDIDIAERLLPIQRSCAEFALRRGRAGIFLGTGLGKSLVQLEFSKHAADATNGRSLILTPLAVAGQFEREAAKFGYDARVAAQPHGSARLWLSGAHSQGARGHTCTSGGSIQAAASALALPQARTVSMDRRRHDTA